MKLDKYKEMQSELKKDFENKNRMLDIKYAISNQKFSIGDLIESNQGKIYVEDVKYSRGFMREDPEAVYCGVQLTKKLNPRKDKNKINIYQSDVK
tara:strand:- start:1662 stop:1946 length:285 start_codon:yes stop_codon:yes gene_type:complete